MIICFVLDEDLYAPLDFLLTKVFPDSCSKPHKKKKILELPGVEKVEEALKRRNKRMNSSNTMQENTYSDLKSDNFPEDIADSQPIEASRVDKDMAEDLAVESFEILDSNSESDQPKVS